MSESNSRAIPDILEQATGALQDAPVPAGPPAGLTAATVAAVNTRLSGAVPAGELSRRERRKRTMRYIGYGTATAAAVSLATAAGVLWLGGGSASALHDALQKAKEAESVGYTQTLAVEGLPAQVEIARVRGEQFRIEDADGSRTRVVNLALRKAMFLDAERKLAQMIEIPVGQGTPPGILDALNKVADQEGEKVGEENVTGVRAIKFKLKGAGPNGSKEEWFVWVDPKTGWPVKMQSRGKVSMPQDDGTEKEVPYTLTLEKFEWDAKFDDKFFALDPPAGYRKFKGIAPPVADPVEEKKK